MENPWHCCLLLEASCSLIFMLSHLYPLCYNFSCFYSICTFPYDKFCSIIKCLQELLYCFKPSRHLSLFHNLLLPSVLCCLLSCLLQSAGALCVSALGRLSCPHWQINFQSFPVYTFLIHYFYCLLHPTVLRLKHKNPVSFPAKKPDYSSHLKWTLTGTSNGLLRNSMSFSPLSCRLQYDCLSDEIQILWLFKRLDQLWGVSTQSNPTQG